MPRYFFHVRDGDELILDHGGLELPDLDGELDEPEFGSKGAERR
jgi:hypothetical protein